MGKFNIQLGSSDVSVDLQKADPSGPSMWRHPLPFRHLLSVAFELLGFERDSDPFACM